MQPMLEVLEISKTFGGTVALDGISIKLTPGIYLVAGPNGAGKTTLLRTVTGAEYPSSGSVILEGKDYFANRAQMRRYINYLSDSVPLYNDMTVEGHLVYRGRLKGLSSRRLRARVRHVTESLGLKAIFTKSISTLSAGQRKCVGIADAMLTDSRILAIDEPFDALDSLHCEMLCKALATAARHTVILLATNRLDAAESIDGQCIVLTAGSLAGVFDIAKRPEGMTISQAVSETLRQYYSKAPEVK